MKRAIQFIFAVKIAAVGAFTGGVMLVTVALMFLGEKAVPIGYIWQIIFLALIFGCLQLYAFSENAFKKSKTFGRMAFLGASMFAALAAFAFFFGWFPAQSVTNWIIFLALYAAVFFIAVFALRTVFRLSGLKYDELLTAYKAQKKSDASSQL